MSDEDRSVPYLSLDYGEVNPNHKVKLFVTFIPQHRWLTSMAFANTDDSIYLAPQLGKSYTVVGMDGDGVQFISSSSPDSETHISLHESGVVNLTIGSDSYRLRHTRIHTSLEVITLGIKNPEGLRVATDEEINSMPSRYTLVSVSGFFMLGPVFVTIFRVRPEDEWEMPRLSHTIQTHVGFDLRGKDTRYEIVVWQNPTIPEFSGDIAYSIGA